MLYALLDDEDAVVRFREFDAPPPRLAAEKQLRWSPVIDVKPEGDVDGDYENPAVEVSGGADGEVVTRTWTVASPRSKPVPVSVSAFQARSVLLDAGLLDGLDAAIDGMDRASRLAWEYAVEIRRDSPLVASLAALLGLSDEGLDDLFRAAAAVTA